MRRVGSLGLGWRPETAWFIQQNPRVEFVEVIAETLSPGKLPRALLNLREEGMSIALHSVSLSLGSPLPLATQKLDALAQLVEELSAQVVSDHVAFAVSETHRAPHFLPVPRTEEQVGVLCQNLRTLKEWVDVPVAIENAAALFEWPESYLSPAAFLRRLLDESGCHVILDLANLYADARNHGSQPNAVIEVLRSDDVAYLHVAGGREEEGVYVDTHAHAVPQGVLELVATAKGQLGPLPTLLEWDAQFPSPEVLSEQLSQLEDYQAEAFAAQVVTTLTLPDPREARRFTQLSLVERQAEILSALIDTDSGGPEGFWPSGFAAARRVFRRKCRGG